MSFKFFSFSKLRQFLKQDLSTLASKRFTEGYRQTYTCETCGITIYSRSSNQGVNCKCGRYEIKENKYHYKFEDYFNKHNTNHEKLRSVQYLSLREIKQ
jgi:hypothetical protein